MQVRLKASVPRVLVEWEALNSKRRGDTVLSGLSSGLGLPQVENRFTLKRSPHVYGGSQDNFRRGAVKETMWVGSGSVWQGAALWRTVAQTQHEVPGREVTWIETRFSDL